MATRKNPVSKVTPILVKKYASLKNISNLINFADGEGHLYVRFPIDPAEPASFIHNFEASTQDYCNDIADFLHDLAEKIRRKEPLEDA